MPTLAYWYRESRAGGSIRVDLLLIYPALSALYGSLLWPRFRWGAWGIALLLMGVKIGFMIQTYAWFQKPVG